MDKLKKHSITIRSLCIALILLFVLAGCGNDSVDQQNDDIDTGTFLIKYLNTPSFGDTNELFTTETTIDVEKNTVHVRHLKIYDKEGQAYDPGKEPVLWEKSADISDSDSVKDMLALINSEKYSKLPERLETEIMDGDYNYISVESKDGISSKKGGLGAAYDGPEIFVDACAIIKNIAKEAGL